MNVLFLAFFVEGNRGCWSVLSDRESKIRNGEYGNLTSNVMHIGTIKHRRPGDDQKKRVELIRRIRRYNSRHQYRFRKGNHVQASNEQIELNADLIPYLR